MDLSLGRFLFFIVAICIMFAAIWCVLTSLVLQRTAHRWYGFLIVGASALLLSLASNAFLTSLVAARKAIESCLRPYCAISLIPYGLRVDGTLLAAMAVAGTACATGAQVAWRHGWWVLVPILVLGVVLPPLVVVGYVLGPIRPLMATGYNVERIVIGQAVLVLLFGIGLLLFGRESAPERHLGASMAGNDGADEGGE